MLAAKCPGCGVMGAGCICAIVLPGTIPTLPTDPIPTVGITPANIPMPQNRQHAEMMLLVAERYLADNGFSTEHTKEASG